ncbi:hypothetical protein AGMMS50239_32790 [Bacteroidia bacterium]|nr:hypothetical protein AGMMS50239_32790 [Bacteroidia bacterium]
MNGGIGNIQNNNTTIYNGLTDKELKKELKKLKEESAKNNSEQKEIRSLLENLLLEQEKSKQEREEKDSIMNREITQKDSAYQAQIEKYEIKIGDYKLQEEDYKNRICLLEKILNKRATKPWHNQNLAPFGIKQWDKANFRHPVTYLGILTGIGTVVGLGYYGYAEYRICGDNNFKYIVNQQDYKDMRAIGGVTAILCYGANVAANYWIDSSKKEQKKESCFNITPITTPQYNGIGLTYNF